LELVLVGIRQGSRAVKVLGSAVHLVPEAREGIVQALLYEGNGQVRNVNTNPLPSELLRRMYGCATAAERVQHKVAGVAGSANDAL
jgi:hypothetical protein